MSEFVNEAAWITSAKAKPMQVKPAPAPTPGEHEVVIKVAYAAVNPVDWKLQEEPAWEINYPFIFGTDVAGTIVQLGSGVTKFKLGQRVIGHCDSYISGKSSNSGFQLYSTCREILVTAIPDALPLANAAVLPISISTASSALFVQLSAPLPSLGSQPTGKKVLIWGGSSSVGISAIQLARGAGLEVIATAGGANHDLVKGLGASYVFDHKSPHAVDEISKLLNPGDFVVDCISSNETQAQCAQILSTIGGGKLPITTSPQGTVPENVERVFVNGLAPGFTNPEVGDAVWGQYVPSALAAGLFQAKPDPFVIKGGLEKVQNGINLLRAGVSAKKVVIEIAQE